MKLRFAPTAPGRPALGGSLAASLGAAALLLAATAGAVQGQAAAAAPRSIERSEKAYPIPNLTVQGADGRRLALAQALQDGRPVVMTFMFSSCTTVCPISNQTLSIFEQMLGADSKRVNIVSISIDPDHDSVQRLADHARRTGAVGSFFTSDPATSEAVQRSFDAWRGDKMNHQPVFLIRRSAGTPWLRLDGQITPRELMAEFRQRMSTR